jgi:hypothetical protein
LGLLEGLAELGLELLGVLLEEEDLLLEVGWLLFGLFFVLVDEEGDFLFVFFLFFDQFLL